MTVPNQIVRNGPYLPNGVTTSFPFTFRALDPDDVEVVRIDAQGNVTTLFSALYNVKVNFTGGSVVFTSPPAAGDPLYVQLSPRFTQEISFENEGAFLPEVLTEALDRSAMRSLWLRDRVLRAFSIPPGGGTQFDGKFAVVLPGGVPGFASGTGADGGLRVDLANPLLGGSLLAYRRAESGAVARNAKSRLDDLGLLSSDFGVPLGGAVDATFALRLLINAGDCTILPGTYRLTGTITFPVGRRVHCMPGVRFQWDGPTADAQGNPISVFVMKSGCSLYCDSEGGATISCSTDQHTLYAVFAHQVDGLTIENISCERCNIVTIDSSPSAAYADIVTPAMSAAGDIRPINMSKSVRITGCTSTFDAANTNWGGINILWCYDWRITRCRIINAGHGIVWLGGGADPADAGQPENERKNFDGYVDECIAIGSGVGGIWGTMGRGITVRNSRAIDCFDVGFDAEGCVDVTFEGCYARNCYNGCYTNFSYSKGVVFLNCTGIATVKERPLFRNYNSSLLPKGGDISIIGGHFECTDPTGFGTIDSAFGPTADLLLKGAKLVNVMVRFVALNGCLNTVDDCDITFTRRAPSGAFAAVEVSNFVGLPVSAPRGFGLVSYNRITSLVLQPFGTLAITMTAGDNNASPLAITRGNTILMPNDGGSHAAILLTHSGVNPGTAGRFQSHGDNLLGPIATHNNNSGVAGVFTVVGSTDENGTAKNITPV